MGGTRGVWRGDGGFVIAAGACWWPLHTFRRRSACEPGYVDRMQPNGGVGGARLRAGLTGRQGRPGRCARDCIPGWWSWLYRPESQGGVGGVAHANPGTSIACNRMARWEGEAKSWPYRPTGETGPVRPGLHPGLVELALQAGIARGAWGCSGTSHVMRLSASNVTAQNVTARLRFGGSCASGLGAFPVLVHSRHCCVCGL